MAGEAHDFVEAGNQYQVDPLFLASIAFHESHYASAYSKETNDQRHNYAGVMSWDKNGVRSLKEYASWHDAIYDHARVIRESYLNKGLVTVGEIWNKYSPISDNPGSTWGPSVGAKYISLRSQI